MFSLTLSFSSIYFLRKSYDNEKEKNKMQKELLEKNSQQKSMFFINLSHEIKTPLTLIQNYLEKYIEEKGADEKLMIMRQNIHKMSRDILDYLNFENIERGSMSLERNEVFSLDNFLAEKISLFSCYAKNKGIALNYEVQQGIIIKANPIGIDQIFNNLLENAVKYTPEKGDIHVSLKVEVDKVIIIIKNSGTIIPSELFPHLFEPFYQLSSPKLNSQGIGMGLYTVKKIVESIGGQISVQSSNEDGVVFSVILPLSNEKQTTEQPISITTELNTPRMIKASDSEYFTNRPNLLVVEDHNDLLRYMVDELSTDYNVFVAENGISALKKLENKPVPDLIISDIMMDGMGGYEFLKNTISDDRYGHIPFIFLTAKDNHEEKITGLALGAIDFITKPFSIAELKMKIKSITEHKSRISEAVRTKIKLEFIENRFETVQQKQDDIFASNILLYKLSSREKEVVVLVKKGLKYEEIAGRLHISEHTISRHIQNIYAKTGISSKTELLEKLYN